MNAPSWIWVLVVILIILVILYLVGMPVSIG
jgi:hypothetical protein